MTEPVTHAAMAANPRLLVDGLCFGEGPRWHNDRLFFSDMHGRAVLTLTLEGQLETLASVPGCPSGLGFDPQGRLLVVSMTDRMLLRSTAAPTPAQPLELQPFADLSSFTTARCNDMVVDAQGRAYVGNFGFGLFEREEVKPARMLLVTPDGQARVVAEDLLFPNGSVITPDGRTLIVAETFAKRLTAFEIADNGDLSNRRVFAALDVLPDGICLDAEGCIWVANPAAPGGFVRVAEGGEVKAQIAADVLPVAEGERPRGGFACALGGPDRRTLFMLEGFSSAPKHGTPGNARIRCVQVDVPGAGLP